MGPRRLFTISNIPVSLDPFLLLGAFLLYQWSGGGRTGLFTVVAILCFTFIHEMGHAFTAKAFGADVAVTLTFLGGFAAYTSRRPLSLNQQILISAAGPVAQIVASLPFLWYSQRLALSSTNMSSFELSQDVYGAVAWAGILLAVMNLLPLWPLDGGHIAEHVLESFIGKRAARPFAIYSIAASAALLLGYFGLSGNSSVAASARSTFLSGFGKNPFEAAFHIAMSAPGLILGQTLFIPLICLFGSWSRLQQLDRQRLRVNEHGNVSPAKIRADQTATAVRTAERSGWTTGQLPEFPRGFVASPWLRAHLALIAGHTDAGRAALSDLEDDAPRNWQLDAPDRPEIAELLNWIPPEVGPSLPVLEARMYHGSPDDLVAGARLSFTQSHSAEPLYLGAGGLAIRGMNDEAMQWLQNAVTIDPDPHRISTAREFRSLHSRSDFQQLLGAAERAAAAS